ncbi:MAG: oligosaccharide flippase family protein [Flavobacteriales bacterium]|nr:oligosaccharide flippase family protein [Flavobacteriales bacterium]MCB9447418.1 oligosaccharide flippase family protein [Flavobacteriales bacterium]
MSYILPGIPVIPVLEVTGRMMAFLSVILVTRILSVEDYGRYSYVLSIVLLVSVVMDGGINSLAFNNSLRNQLDELPSLFTTKNFFSLIAAVLFFAIIGVFKPDYFFLVMLATGSIFFTGSVAFVKMIARGQTEIRTDSLAIVAEPLFRIIVLGIIWIGGIVVGLEMLLLTLLLVSFLAFIVLYGLAKSRYPLDIGFSSIQVKKVFTSSRWYLMYYFALVGIKRSEVVLLNGMLDTTSVAYYSAAFNIYLSLQLFFTAFVSSKLKLAVTSQWHDARRSVLQVAVYAIAVVLFVVLFAKVIFGVIYPVEYAHSHLFLQYLVLGLPFYIMTEAGVYLLNYMHKTRQNAFVLATAMCVKVIMLLVVHPASITQFIFCYVFFETALGVIYLALILRNAKRFFGTGNMKAVYENTAG